MFQLPKIRWGNTYTYLTSALVVTLVSGIIFFPLIESTAGWMSNTASIEAKVMNKEASAKLFPGHILLVQDQQYLDTIFGDCRTDDPSQRQAHPVPMDRGSGPG